jgi:hypothetical protein
MKLGDIEVNANNEVSGFQGKQVIIPIEEYEHLKREIKHLNGLVKDKPCIRVATEYYAFYSLYGNDEYIEWVTRIQSELKYRMDEWLSLNFKTADDFKTVEAKLPNKISDGLSHLLWNRWYDIFKKKK